MKKLLITATVTLACVAAFAQGKITSVNDSAHVVYMTTSPGGLLPTDAASAGLAAPTAITATLSVDLWAGTSSSSLQKMSTTSFGAIPGRWTSQSISTIPFTTLGFFQVQVYSTLAGSEAQAAAGSLWYYGVSDIFTVVPGTGASYNSIVATGTPASSTWAQGSYHIPASNNLGAIMLQANVPEPTTIALAGLGIASLMIFRRRK